jgi:hypothetical protein
MSSSSSSENNSRDVARRRKEELELVKDFWTVVQNRAEEIQRRELGKTSGERSFQLEGEERKIFYEINNFGLLPAAAAGLATLMVLRNVRPNMLRRIQRPKPPTNTGAPPHVTNSPFQQGTPPGGESYKQLQPSPFLRVFGWSMDLISSFLVAAGASIMLTDHEAIAQKVTTLPLVSGRGRVAEELCHPMLDFLKEIRKDESTREVLEGATTTNLKNILTFCQNCQRRAAYEDRLRRENGLSSDAPVSIPPPGVPVDDNGGSDTIMAGWNDALASGDFYDPSQEQSKSNEYGTDSQESADSMVSDREEDDSRRP